MVFGGTLAWWLHAPLPMGTEPLELAIEPGTPPRAIARDIEQAGVRVDARILFAWFRRLGQGARDQGG